MLTKQIQIMLTQIFSCFLTFILDTDYVDIEDPDHVDTADLLRLSYYFRSRLCWPVMLLFRSSPLFQIQTMLTQQIQITLTQLIQIMLILQIQIMLTHPFQKQKIVIPQFVLYLAVSTNAKQTNLHIIFQNLKKFGQNGLKDWIGHQVIGKIFSSKFHH